jgi:hypothetical protein
METGDRSGSGCFSAPKLKGREITIRLRGAISAFDLEPFQGFSQGGSGSQG